MSYEVTMGIDEINEEEKDQGKDWSSALYGLKSDTSVKVRVMSTKDIAKVMMHSVYQVFYSTPCAGDDYYDEATALLYNDAKNAATEKEAEELKKQAGQLRAKPRYLCGFINLETGEPIIVDLSFNQKNVVSAAIKKYEKRLGKLAFELAKSGTGTGTTVTFSPVIDMEEDLTEKERQNFDKVAADYVIPREYFTKSLYVKKPEEQLEDLRKFGFDISRLQIGEGEAEQEAQKQEADPTLDF